MDLRRIRDMWRRCDVVIRDIPLALALVVASFLPMFRGQETQIGDLPPRPLDALGVVLLLLLCLPLAVRRRRPAVCLALVALAFVAAQLRGYHLVAGTGLTLALISAGAHLAHHRRTAVALLTAAYVAMAIALNALGAPETPGGFVIGYALMTIAWGVGSWVRSTRAAEAERRLRVAEATRAAERTRIARELHDVVTHHVPAMVVQADAARYQPGVPERLDATLGSIGDAGREAIGDLRRMLDVLNPDHDAPAGPAADIPGLVERTRLAGQPVEFTEDGSPAATARGAASVAYRVVQEALTNALKYAHGSRTVVGVRHGEKEITVEVSTDGSGARPFALGGSGRGLAGLRGRVDTLGGEFSAGRRAGGGFVVRARIPAEGFVVTESSS